jgi:predicted transcriptional regulator
MGRRSNPSRVQGDATIIPIAAVLDTRLILSDLRVLCLLGLGARPGEWTRRSQVEIARHLNLARSTVQRSLARLETLGWVSIRPACNSGPGRKPNWYRLIATQKRSRGRSVEAGDGSQD